MMAITTQRSDPEPEKLDDYHVAGHVGEMTRSAAHHTLSAINGLLLIVMAAVSLALFWVVASMLNII
jgi:hypothetical protein